MIWIAAIALFLIAHALFYWADKRAFEKEFKQRQLTKSSIKNKY